MITKEALDLIKKWEGFRATAYKDAVGIWTIGYGTTANAGVGIDPKAGMTITESQAESFLRAAVTKFADNIRAKMVMRPNDNEFGAMVSLAYNIGPGAFGRSSVLRLFNEGKKKEAADAFLLWNKAGGKVLRGLTNRRIEERALFLKDVASSTIEKPNWLAEIIKAILRMIGSKK